MGSHHDHNDHHSNEKKPVSFTVPLIFAISVVVIILAFVSIGDPDHCCDKGECSKECKEKCEMDGNKAHEGKTGGDAHGAKAEEKDGEEQGSISTGTTAVADSTAKTEHKAEEAHH